MIKWKALAAGISLVLVLGLVLQLAFTSYMVGQLELSKSYPEYSSAIKLLPYLIGFGGYFLVMIAGGYLTAAIALDGVLLHAAIVGALTAGVSVWLSLSAGGIKLMSLIFFALGVLFAVVGAMFWLRRHRKAMARVAKADQGPQHG